MYICDYYAKQIYAPGQNPNDPNILSSPTKAFDQCGWLKYTSLDTFTTETFASEHTTSAEAFFQSYAWRNQVLEEANSFEIKVVGPTEMESLGVGCLAASYSGAQVVSLSAVGLAILAATFMQ